MNRWIASIFAGLLAVLHVLVLLGGVGTVVYYYSDDGMMFRGAVIAGGASIGIDGDLAFFLLLAVCFFAYVLLIGFLSTIVAINANLERIYRKLSESTK